MLRRGVFPSTPMRTVFAALPHKRFLVLLGVLGRLPDLVSPMLFGSLISAVSGGESGRRVYLLAGGVLFFALLALLVSWGNERLSALAFAVQARRLKELVWDHVQDLPVLVRDASSPGVWMQKLSRDIPVIQSTCQMLLETGLGLLVFFFGALMLILWKAPLLSAVLAMVIGAAAVTHRLLGRALVAQTRQVRETFYRQSEVLLGLIEMLPILGVFGVAPLFKPLIVSSIVQATESECGQQQKIADYKALVALEIWGVRAAVLLGCTFLFLDSRLAVGDIVMYDLLIAQVLGGLSQVIFVLPQVGVGLEYANSLREVLSPPDVPGDAAMLPCPQPPARRASELGSGASHPPAFHIESLTFRYAPDAPAVIADFSASISPGEFVCFLGRNGTGKSTLAKLLSGAYQPVLGTIEASDRKPGIVPQNIVVYRDSLLENVRLRDQSIPESHVEATLLQCGFRGFLEAHRSGIHTSLSPGSCSGGELQMLGIARAMVRNPETLILDELTNNLDVVAKEAVHSVLAGLHEYCTIILITHDLSSTELSDRLFVFRRSGISEIHGSDAAMRTRTALRLMREEA